MPTFWNFLSHITTSLHSNFVRTTYVVVDIVRIKYTFGYNRESLITTSHGYLIATGWAGQGALNPLIRFGAFQPYVHISVTVNQCHDWE